MEAVMVVATLAGKVQQMAEVAVVALALLVAVVLVAVAAAVAMTALDPLAPPAQWPRIPATEPAGAGLLGEEPPLDTTGTMQPRANAAR